LKNERVYVLPGVFEVKANCPFDFFSAADIDRGAFGLPENIVLMRELFPTFDLPTKANSFDSFLVPRLSSANSSRYFLMSL
jgi:hypothetical protein